MDIKFKDSELRFLELICTDITYKEIASKMFLSIRTIEGYRRRMYIKCNAKSRIGLVLFAVRNGLAKIS